MQGNLVYRFGFSSSSKQFIFNHRLSALSAHQKCSVHKQTLYEKLNIPPKPKKPLTPFFKFLEQIRPTLVKEYPDKKCTELSKIAGQRWSVVDSKLKEKLQEQYKKDSVDYGKIVQEYEIKLTTEQKAEIKKAEQHNLDVQEERKTKKKSKELGKPKQPISSFLRYLAMRDSERSKYSDVKLWVKSVAAEWRSLSPEVKAKIEEERKRDFETWKNELNVWEEKMIKAGNLDVVRSGSLLPLPKTKLKK